MSAAQKWKYALLGAALPTVAVGVLLACAGVVVRFVSGMGPRDIARKTENYAALCEEAPEDSTVFFGDSITELCPVEELYADFSRETGSPILNRGISAETTDNMLARARETVALLYPRNVVLLMGTNDLNQGKTPDEIAENVRQIIRVLRAESPRTNVVLEAVYPTAAKRESAYENYQLRGRDNAAIRALNARLAAVAEAEGVRFLDLTALLADEEGNLRGDYTYDGLHPNMAGYFAVRDAVAAALR